MIRDQIGRHIKSCKLLATSHKQEQLWAKL